MGQWKMWGCPCRKEGQLGPTEPSCSLLPWRKLLSPQLGGDPRRPGFPLLPGSGSQRDKGKIVCVSFFFLFRSKFSLLSSKRSLTLHVRQDFSYKIVFFFFFSLVIGFPSTFFGKCRLVSGLRINFSSHTKAPLVWVKQPGWSLAA